METEERVNPYETKVLPLVALHGPGRYRHTIITPSEQSYLAAPQENRRTPGIDRKGRVVAVQPSLFETDAGVIRRGVASPDVVEFESPATQAAIPPIEEVYSPPEPVVDWSTDSSRDTQPLDTWKLFWQLGGWENRWHAVKLWASDKLERAKEDAQVAYSEVLQPFFSGIFHGVAFILGLEREDVDETTKQYMRFTGEGPNELTLASSGVFDINTSDTTENTP